MDKNNSKKIKIKKIPISRNFRKENFSQSSRNTINKVLIPFNRIKSSKEIKIKNKFNFSDPLKQKILNKIRKSKSRQSIFSKSQYLFYGKDEINIRTNNTLKSTIEMENKFYIRSKKGIKPEYQSDSLLKILAKDPTKVLQKIILNYGGLLKHKNRENIKDGGGGENLEDIIKKEQLNHNNNFDLRKKKKLSHTFIISKPSKFINSYKNKNNKYRLSFFIPNSPSSSQSKTIMSNSFSNINDFKNEKDVYFENIAKHNINIIKKILKNRMKKNSKMLSDSLINLGDDNLPYEPINEIISNRKIGQNIYILDKKKFDVNEICYEWYNEKKNYDFNSNKYIKDTGHFTQLVWKSSKYVGFGCSNNNQGKKYFVANYYPAGNTFNEFRENVSKAIK